MPDTVRDGRHSHRDTPTGQDAQRLSLWYERGFSAEPPLKVGLELRIADVQTRPTDAAAIAAVWQTLVAALIARFRRGESLPVHETHRVSENRWRALRDGLDGYLVDLDTGTAVPARERIGELLLELEPYADELGCAEQLAHAWSLQAENGAERQRQIATWRGFRGLLEWLADESELSPAAGAERRGLAPHGRLAPAAVAASSAV